MGSQLKELLRREESGREVPELLSRPRLSRTEEFLMRTFEKLSTERAFGLTAGPVPHSLCLVHAEKCGFDPEDFWDIMSSLDAVWREKASGAVGRGRLPDQDSNRPVRRGKRKSEG